MKVLFVYDTVAPYGGGSQIVVFNWMRNLQKLGIDIKLLCDQSVLYVNPELKEHVIINPSLPLGKKFARFSLNVLLTSQTKKKILEYAPDIIHTHEQFFLSQQIQKWAKKNHIKTISSFNGNYNKFSTRMFPLSLFLYENAPLNKYLDLGQARMLKNADFITAPSVFYKHKLETELNKNVFLVNNPVNDAFFSQPLAKTDIPRKLITFSRLSGEKKIDVLIDMMVFLRKKCTLTIVGEGMDKTNLEEKVKKLNLDDIVTFTGWISHTELPNVLSHYDLFVSSSNFETFGLTYIEALAVHLPCVVYDYNVSREVIPEGTSIFLNNLIPKTWAEEIEKILNKESYASLREKISIHYELIKQYNEVESTKKLISLYKRVITS